MRKDIENILDEINFEQTTGVFQVPLEIEDAFKRYFWKVRENTKETPLVVAEETYYRNGVIKKMSSCWWIVNKKLSFYNLIRQQQNNNYSEPTPETMKIRKPVSTLSLAQTLSWLYQKPVEEILVSEDLFQSKEFLKKSPSERVKILFNAYTGTRWFEYFKKRTKKYMKKIPKIRESQRISREDLTEWFICANEIRCGTIRKLCNKGFIIPANGREFRRSSLNNLVNTEGLAQLIASITDSDIKKILVTGKDNYIEELAELFIKNKLLPYLSEHCINPNSLYSISSSAKISGMNYLRIYSSLRNGTFKNTKFNGGKSRITGLSLAFYALRKNKEFSFTREKISKLFGVDEVDTKKLGMHSSSKETYSRHHYVFPIYDLVTSVAREIFEQVAEKNSIEIPFQRSILYLSSWAQAKYLKKYALKKFDEDCLIDLREQLSDVRYYDGKRLETNNLVFKIKNNLVEDIFIR